MSNNNNRISYDASAEVQALLYGASLELPPPPTYPWESDRDQPYPEAEEET